VIQVGDRCSTSTLGLLVVAALLGPVVREASSAAAEQLGRIQCQEQGARSKAPRWYG
jgi:hypothetical protein